MNESKRDETVERILNMINNERNYYNTHDYKLMTSMLKLAYAEGYLEATLEALERAKKFAEKE